MVTPSAAGATSASMAETKQQQHQHRPLVTNEFSASLVSRWLFLWLDPLMRLGASRTLQQHDLPVLDPRDEADCQYDRFEAKLRARTVPGKEIGLWTLVQALVASYRRPVVASFIYKALWDISQFIMPVVLYVFLAWLQLDPSSPYSSRWYGLALAGIMLAVSAAVAVLQGLYTNEAMRLGVNIRVALASSVYRKALRLSVSSRDANSTGKLVNMMSVDTLRVEMFMWMWNWLWSGPLTAILVIALLYLFMGPGVLGGVVVIVVMLPAQFLIASRMERHQKNMLVHTDERVKLTNEILSGIRVIKFYSWEQSFVALIEAVRKRELAALWRWASLRSFTSWFFIALPIGVIVASFTTHILLGGALTPQLVFPALAMFNLLRMPLTVVPMAITFYLQFKVAMQRLGPLLSLPDVPQRVDASVGDAPQPRGTVLIRNASFSWSPDASVPPVLHDLSLHVRPGQLTVLVGPVGSGKSTLLSAVLSEAHVQLHGADSVSCSAGRVAYVGQTAWVMNDTLRGNIIFGADFDAQRYQDVLRACALLPDLQVLPAGDMTEIGEKGINLSGGQKQRVALARASYADADIVLMDDSLSAVDAHVGRHLFQQCICGAMASRTRILASNQIQFLPDADHVVVLHNGSVRAQGTYTELVASGIDFEKLVHLPSDADADAPPSEPASPADIAARVPTAKSSDTPATAADVADAAATPMSEPNEETAVAAGSPGSVAGGESIPPSQAGTSPGATSTAAETAASTATGGYDKSARAGKLMTKEGRQSGVMSKAVFSAYFSAVRGPALLAGVALAYVLQEVGRVGADSVLASWSSSADASMHANTFLLFYVILGVLAILATLIRTVGSAFLGVRASRTLHRALFTTVLRAPTSFFDTTPIGRVLNRFSKDLDAIDVQLPTTMMQWIGTIVFISSTMLLIVVVSRGLFLIFAVGIGYAYYKVSMYFRTTSRELKRLESVSSSPIYAHLQETLGGVDSIRAYGSQQRFLQENVRRLNNNTQSNVLIRSAMVWLSVRLLLLGAVIVSITCGLTIALLSIDTGIDVAVLAALAGLGVAYAVNVTSVMNWNVRNHAEVENFLNAVERVKEYTSELAVEAAPIIHDSRPPAGWPTAGYIQVQSLSLRYRPELERVLHNVSLEIQPGEKVGVVGRTGAGKSSLMLALLRIIEADGGAILIDGLDIASIGLDDLRSNLSIIPQDPVIFSGTLRFNLDPFNQHSDERLWEVLQHAHLRAAVERLPGKLEAVVSEGGSNFSQGERQLLCIARAILRASKVLLLDEATSSIDAETDALVQATFRSEFANCTVLTIAHRLNTIMDSDRVLVMAEGKVAEFAPPRVLLADPSSALSAMAADTGAEHAEALRTLAGL